MSTLLIRASVSTKSRNIYAIVSKTAHLAFMSHELISKFYEHSIEFLCHENSELSLSGAVVSEQCEDRLQQPGSTSNLIVYKITCVYYMTSHVCYFISRC